MIFVPTISSIQFRCPSLSLSLIALRITHTLLSVRLQVGIPKRVQEHSCSSRLDCFALLGLAWLAGVRSGEMMRSCFAFPVNPKATKKRGVNVGSRILNFSVVRNWMRRLGRHRTLKRHAITAGARSNSSMRSTTGSRNAASDTGPSTLYLDPPQRHQRRPSTSSDSAQSVVV